MCCGRCEYRDEDVSSPHFGVDGCGCSCSVSCSAARLVSAFAASQPFVIDGQLPKR